MFKTFVKAALLCIPLTLLSAQCGNPFTITDKELQPGGLYVTYVQDTNCTGCNALGRGDLIQQIDGNPVASTKDVATLTDGQPHELGFWDASEGAPATASITAEPNNSMPPIKDAPPFWSVAADDLKTAPSWARRRLFGHAVPQILLVNSDGGFVNGRDLYGKKHLMVFFDWAASSDRQNGALTMQVLQKAQADLKAKGIEIIFAQIKHPQQRDIAPMNDTDLRKFFSDNQVKPNEGGPLPPPPLYRMPNKTEDNPTRVLGMEGAFTFYEAIGEAPNIFLINEDGIIVWHSAGTVPDPEGKISVDMVYTINKAVMHALENL
ncbi:MAG: hypothetical protein R6X02_09460 [Enhygromyxa sp.]